MTKEEINNLKYKILNYYIKHHGNDKLKRIILKGEKNELQRKGIIKGKIQSTPYVSDGRIALF